MVGVLLTQGGSEAATGGKLCPQGHAGGQAPALLPMVPGIKLGVALEYCQHGQLPCPTQNRPCGNSWGRAAQGQCSPGREQPQLTHPECPLTASLGTAPEHCTSGVTQKRKEKGWRGAPGRKTVVVRVCASRLDISGHACVCYCVCMCMCAHSYVNSRKRTPRLGHQWV